MDTSGINNQFRDHHDPNEPAPSSEKVKPQTEDLKPTSKGVENAKKRLRAFSIQKKSSLSPIPPPKTICTTVGSVGTVFIGKLATSKPVLKPGDIEEVVDPKKPPKPPKPGTSKLQNADYLNIQKKTLSEIEAMKRKMELVDLGIPLGLICPVSTSDKAMPTKAMPPIKSMLLARKMRVLHPLKESKKPPARPRNVTTKNPAKVDEIIREAKQAKAEGKSFKFSYEKLLPTYQNPFQKSKDKDKDVAPPPIDHHRQSRDRRKYNDQFRRYPGHSEEKRGRDWHRDAKDRMRANVIRSREESERLDKIKRSKERSKRSEKSKTEKSKTDVKSKEKDTKEKKVDTINLSDEDDDDVQEVIDGIQEKEVKEADVNLKDFVVCDSWSENEERTKDSTPINDKKEEKEFNTTPVAKHIDPMEQLKQSLLKEIEHPVECKVEKLQPVTDTFKYEIEDVNDDDDETLDMFAEVTTVKKVTTEIRKPHKTNLYDALVPIRFDYNDDNSNDAMDDTFLESVIAEIKQEDIDDEIPQDKGLVEYDISPKDERESVTPELDDKIREMYSSRSDYSDGFKSVESVKSIDSVKSFNSMNSAESGYKSIESKYKSPESRTKVRENSEKRIDKLKESGRRTHESRSKSVESIKSTDSGSTLTESFHSSTDSSQRSSDKSQRSSQRSQRSTERSQTSTENSQTSTESESTLLSSIELHTEEVNLNIMSKSMVDSLETWSFVMKICQPLLFRHDKNKCYKESPGMPKIWWCENPKLCNCVKDRVVVYQELEMCKMELVDTLYGTYQIQEGVYPEARGWYPAAFLTESEYYPLTNEWEAEDSQERPTPPPHTRDEMVLDREYQKFMEAVWPDVEGAVKSETPRSTPVRETKKRPGKELEVAKKKKIKLAERKQSSEGWSQESEVEGDLDKSQKQKVGKKRKRKHSTGSEDESSKKKKKIMKKQKNFKVKSKTKRQRLSKKYLKKLKVKQEKQFKKKKVVKLEESDADEQERARRKREKKLKKKKLLKLKKKSSKKKYKARSSSPSSSDSDSNKKKKEKRKKRNKRKPSSSDSNQSELFDVNILKNIKTERLTDDEKAKNYTNKKHREIINVKQLQNDFVSIQIKKEVEDVNSPDEFEESFTEEEKKEMENELKEEESEKAENKEEDIVEVDKVEDITAIEIEKTIEEKDEHEFKEPECTRPYTPQLKPHPDESNSQCSSQESIISVKSYEKDDSHLRPSSQNSNYSFHDVMQNVNDNELYVKHAELEMEGSYEQGNYEMYEQMAMEYQSDVASQRVPPPDEQTSGRIETVVMSRTRGEIKCDWRAGDPPTPPHAPPSQGGIGRPSRWGLKPSEVNIVLTGGSEEQPETFPIKHVMSPTVYKIQSLANRTDNSNSGYDEAYMDMYGASDRLQYGDCFSHEAEDDKKPIAQHTSSLDDRINLALRTAVLDVEMNDGKQENDEDSKGILVTKSLVETRPVKRVSFADGYKPGQDSDTEEPPVQKRKRRRRTGCPWPCAVTHADHVPLWDALPPPPPPPGSPPPLAALPPPPAALLRAYRPHVIMHQFQPPHPMNKFNPHSLAAFMPPEPPPGLISF